MNPSLMSQITAPQAPAPVQQTDPSEFGDYSDWARDQMAKGISSDQLHQTLQEKGITAKKQGGGNWFTHLLPTIGSVAVPALGALLAPVTGGTSLIAAAGLSGLGAAGGKLAQNALEGKDTGHDVVKEGLFGFGGGLLGGIGGKLLGKASSVLGGTGEKIAARKAASLAAEDAIEGTARAYKDVSPALQKLYNAKDSLAHVANMGFDATNPEELIKMSRTSGDVLNSVLDRALAQSGPVKLDYSTIVKDALAKESGNLGSFEKIALSRGRLGNANTPAAKLYQELQDLGAGIIKPDTDPNELRTLVSKISAKMTDAKPKISAITGVKDPVETARYNAIKDVWANLKKSLYDRPEVNDLLKAEIGNLTPEDVGTKQLADHLNTIITKAGHGDKGAAQDFLDELSRNIDISHLGEEGQKVGQIVTSTGAKARAAAEMGLDNPGVDTHPLLQTAEALTNNGGGSFMGSAVKGAVKAAQNPAVLSTLSRIGKLGSKLAPAAGAVMATAPNLAADPVAMAGGGMPGSMPGGTMGGNMNLQQGGNDLQNLMQAMQTQAILAPSMAGESGATSFLAQMAPILQKNRMLNASLSGIPESFANAGGAQGQAGILSRISGLIPGTAANTYKAQQEAAAQQLAATMGISPQAAMGLLPQLMQDNTGAGLNLGLLGQMTGQLAY